MECPPLKTTDMPIMLFKEFVKGYGRQKIVDVFLGDLLYEPGMLELLHKLFKHQFQLSTFEEDYRRRERSGGEHFFQFEKITDDSEVTVQIMGQEVKLWLAPNARPISYDSALEAASEIPRELEPPSFDFGNLF